VTVLPNSTSASASWASALALWAGRSVEIRPWRIVLKPLRLQWSRAGLRSAPAAARSRGTGRCRDCVFADLPWSPFVHRLLVRDLALLELALSPQNFGLLFGLTRPRAPNSCRLATELSSNTSPSAATATCACSSSKQPGSFWCGRRTGRSTALAWLARAAQRLHPNVLAAALANKLARIAWTVLAQERSYEARVTTAAA
jgi:hypothetical protein